MVRVILITISLIVLIVSLLLTGCSISDGITDKVATVVKISVSDTFGTSPYVIQVVLKPEKLAVAGKLYDVDLYENAKLRATATDLPPIVVPPLMLVPWLT